MNARIRIASARAGNKLREEQDPLAAAEHYLRACRPEEEAPLTKLKYWLACADALGEIGRLQEAAQHAWHAVSLAPEAWEAWGSLGNVMVLAREWRMALAAFEGVARLAPDPTIPARYLLPVGYRTWATGDDDLAWRINERVIQLDPGLPEGRLNRAWLLAVKGKSTEAMAEARKGLAEIDRRGAGDPRIDELRQELARLAKGGSTERHALLEPYQELPRLLTAGLRGFPRAGPLAVPMEALNPRIFPMGGGTSLRMSVPFRWSQEVKRMEQPVALAVSFHPGREQPFKVRMSILRGIDKNFDLEAAFESAVREALGDKTPTRQRLSLLQGEAFWSLSEDSQYDPGSPNDYRYALVAVLRQADVVAIVTTLSQDGSDRFVQSILDLIRSMVVEPAAGP